MNKGFTLVEMLVALVISGLLISGVYSAFETQQKNYLVQEQVVEMQQNIRAGLEIIAHDLRLAGYDSSEDDIAGATITNAEIDAITFSADLDDDGSTSSNGENFGYDRYDSATLGVDVLGRSTSSAAISVTEPTTGHFEVSGHDPFVLNVDGLEFYYQLEDGSQTTSPTDPADIRSIQVSLLVRTTHSGRNYMNSDTYTTPSGDVWGPYNDNYRRIFHTMTVQCRNMGL